ncbi:MAG: hypothetical protein IJX82_01790 [Clostridia bacterium]|nr:hypothetical protein [Clostridia bacterium]
MELQKRSLITPEMLDGKAFVESLLEAGLETGLLSETEHARLQYSLLELLASRLEALYGKETSSVPDEVAGEVFESLLYTLGAFLKTAPDGDAALTMLKETDPAFLYQKGLRRLQILTRDVRVLAGEVFATRIPCKNGFYNTATGKELYGFLRSYRPRSHAHEHGQFMYYATALPCRDLAGVEYIRRYAVSLLWENRFCGLFPKEEVASLLDSPAGRTENIFLLVLKQACGRVLAGQDLSSLVLTAEDGETIRLLHGDKGAKELTAFLAAALRVPEGSYPAACLPAVGKELAAAIQRGSFRNVLKVE